MPTNFSRREIIKMTGAIASGVAAWVALPGRSAWGTSSPGADLRNRELTHMGNERLDPRPLAASHHGLALFDPDRGRHLPTLLSQGLHFHEAFGLTFSTPFPCPELFSVAPTDADVQVVYGSVPPITEPVFNGSWNQIQFVNGEFLYNKTGVTRALVAGGDRIVLQRIPWVHDDEVRYSFLSIIMTALLLQRGIMPMHASAIVASDGAVLFLGPSGAGKSTLAAELVRRGHALQADDIAPIVLDAGKPVVVPGFPQLKLALDAAAHLDQPQDGVAWVRPGEAKLSVLKHDRFHRHPLPLLAIVLLEPSDGDAVKMRKLDAVAKIQTLVNYTFNQSFLDGLGRRSQHFGQVTQVGNHADVYVVERPNKGWQLPALADFVEQRFLSA